VSNKTQMPLPCAVITGSSSGIGRCITEHLLNNGWRVIGLDIAPSAIENPHLTTIQVNLSDESSITSVVNALPNAEAFIHAAGLLRVGRLGELNSDNGAGAIWETRHWRNVRTAKDSVRGNTSSP